MKGSNNIKTSSIGRGQTIATSYPMDNVQNEPGGKMSIPDTMGGSFKGSQRNLKHSLAGADAVDPQGLGLAGSAKVGHID
jgi:hypothetical protein